MKYVLDKITMITKDRIVRNTLFCILVFSYTAVNSSTVYQVYSAVLTILLVTPAFINNLVLIPRFAARKRYRIYLVLVLAITYMFAFCYTWVLKFMLQQSLAPTLSNVVQAYNERTSADMSLASVFRESVPAYYGVFLVLICIFNMAWYIGMNERQQKIIEQEKMQRAAAELVFLKNQINPHFLFNTLNNLYSLILIQSDEAKAVVLKLSGILRYLLYESDVTSITFEMEREVMESYIELELLRLKDVENISFTISADKPYHLPPLLWVPVLENIFKHGSKATGREQLIDFRFIIINGELIMYSKNSVNTQGYAKEKPGIGIGNLQKRLALLYPGRHSVHTQMADSNFVTEIKIML